MGQEKLKRLILVDVYEKQPWKFERTKRKRLKVGDYSLQGFESRIAVERKSLRDFAGSLLTGRLFSQARRLVEVAYPAIIVEGSIQDVIVGRRGRKIKVSAWQIEAATVKLAAMRVPTLFFWDEADAAKGCRAFMLECFAAIRDRDE